MEGSSLCLLCPWCILEPRRHLSMSPTLSHGAHRTVPRKTCSFTVEWCMLVPFWLNSHAGHDREPFMLALMEFVDAVLVQCRLLG